MNDLQQDIDESCRCVLGEATGVAAHKALTRDRARI